MMLTIEDLHFRYSAMATFYRFDLTAKPGEIIGIVGKSGSGKSTLLDLIAGFQKPLEGSIQWNSDEISALPPEVRPVTILFQANNLFEHLSALQNVALGIDPRIVIDDLVRVQAINALSEVGLSGFEYKKAGQLSGGQKQRVALARSLARKQPILLLDEPFSGLDVETKSECLILTEHIARTQNAVVLMVTHDLSDCEKIATRIFQVTEQDHTSTLKELE